MKAKSPVEKPCPTEGCENTFVQYNSLQNCCDTCEYEKKRAKMRNRKCAIVEYPCKRKLANSPIRKVSKSREKENRDPNHQYSPITNRRNEATNH